MGEVFPRRNLGQAEYWGRVVEDRINNAEKTLQRSTGSLSGLVRADSATQGDLGRQIDSLNDALLELQAALLANPAAGSNSSSRSGFALTQGWNFDILTANIQVPTGKTNLNVVANGRVTIKDDGPTGGGGGGGGYFQWVFSPSLISSEYGYRPGGFHSGTDFAGGAASSGSPIYAPADGVVLSKGTDGSRGNYINLRHEPGLITRYFHMNAPSPLSTGTPVSRNETILGYVGNTGASQGAHLHWETYIEGGPLNEENYPAMNPRDFMSIYGGAGTPETPSTGEYASIIARIRIGQSASVEFQPYRIFFNEPDPNYIQDFYYPIHGATYNGTTAPVSLDIWTSAAIPSESFNTASLNAFGVFS